MGCSHDYCLFPVHLPPGRRGDGAGQESRCLDEPHCGFGALAARCGEREPTVGARQPFGKLRAVSEVEPRLASTTVVPAQAGIYPTWSPAFAGVTRAAIFMSMGGPQVHGRSVEGSRQGGEVRLGELLSPPEEAHGDKEIGKKRTPEVRHRHTIRRGGDDGHGRDADRKTGGPRYLVHTPALCYSYSVDTWASFGQSSCVKPSVLWSSAGIMNQGKGLRRPSAAIRQILAKNIRLLRSRLGVSQERLADMCGLHRTYVGAIERAERNVTLSTLEVFSKALGVSVPNLLTPRPRRHEGKE